jgi:hypothetical protein
MNPRKGKWVAMASATFLLKTFTRVSEQLRMFYLTSHHYPPVVIGEGGGQTRG